MRYNKRLKTKMLSSLCLVYKWTSEMNVYNVKENIFSKIKRHNLCVTQEAEVSNDVNTCEYIDAKIRVTLNTLEHLDKLIGVLSDRVKKIEKNIELKELEGKLNKHYEQSRRR